MNVNDGFMNNPQRVAQALQNSILPPADQAEFIDTLKRMSEDEQVQFVKLIEDNSSYAKQLAENYLAKKAVFASKNSSAWKKVVAAEETDLERIEKE